MNLRSIVNLLLAGLILLMLSACSGNTGDDPVRTLSVSKPTVSADNVINLFKQNGNVQVVVPQHSYAITLNWSDKGLSVTNNGPAVYDMTLSRDSAKYFFGIIQTGMTSASLEIPLKDGSNEFVVSFKEKAFIEINGQIIHTIGFDDQLVQNADSPDAYVKNQVVFGFKNGIADSERFRLMRDHNLILIGYNSRLGMHVGQITDGKTPQDVVTELKAEPSVKWPGLNGLMRVASPAYPNDHVWKKEWPDDYRWAMQRIKADRAWDVYKDGVEGGIVDARVKNVVLCISDTGVYPHTDLGLDQLDMWAAYTYSKNFVSTYGLPYDAYGHGTSCAGIAGGMGNNGVGIAGVSWNPYFLSLKCLSDYGSGSFEGIGNSIAYIGELAEMFPWLKFIANYSLGGWSDDPWMREAAGITNGYPNTILVAAAGNNGYEGYFYPSSIPDFISVGASTKEQVDDGGVLKDKEVYNECPYGWGTNWNDQVDVCAPGTMFITTTNIPWNTMWDSSDPNCPVVCEGWYCDHFGGTSAATPHVTGLCALVWSKYPTWTKEQVKQKIFDTADPMYLPPEKIGKLGSGRINCLRAITE